MSLFKNLMNLLDEDSNDSIDKKITQVLDKVEATFTGGMNKVENNVKKVDTAFNKFDSGLQKTVNTADKVMHEVTKPRLDVAPKNSKTMDIVDPKPPKMQQ